MTSAPPLRLVGAPAPAPLPPVQDAPPRWWHALVAGLAHGLLMALAFAPIGLWGAALLAPLPIAWLIERSPGRGARVGLIAAAGVLPFWLFEQAWVFGVSAAGYIPMCLYLSAFTFLLVWVGARARRRFPRWPAAVLIPIVWTGVEFFRGAVAFDGYPWFFIAHPLIDFPQAAWPASLLGVYAVSFIAAVPSGAVLDLRSALRRRQRGGMIAFGAWAIIIVVGSGWTAGGRAAPAGSLLRLAVVQTNVPQSNKIGWPVERRLRDWARFEELIRRAAAADPPPELIVLPETMFPGMALDPASLQAERAAGLAWQDHDPPIPTTTFADALLDLQDKLGIPILIGAIGHDALRFEQSPDGISIRFDARYNSALIVDRGRPQPERYDKIFLTPFGETMPYISRWPWLQQQLLAIGARGMAFDLSPGHTPAVLPVRTTGGQVRIATPICFEATMPGVCRRLVFYHGARRADLLINLTNDGWFGWWDAGRRQHLQLARWRALELGTPVVRAANTGISALIGPTGAFLRAGVDSAPNPARVDGVLVVDVPKPLGATLYARVGDLFGIAALVVAGGLLLASFIRTSSSRPRADATTTPRLTRSPK